jgi:hypothetical protein
MACSKAVFSSSKPLLLLGDQVVHATSEWMAFLQRVSVGVVAN